MKMKYLTHKKLHSLRKHSGFLTYIQNVKTNVTKAS